MLVPDDYATYLLALQQVALHLFMLHTDYWPHPCHNRKVPDAMSDVVAARDAYQAARKRVKETRLALGRAIRDAREQDVPQVKIAEALGLTREQVRRYQAEFERATS